MLHKDLAAETKLVPRGRENHQRDVGGITGNVASDDEDIRSAAVYGTLFVDQLTNQPPVGKDDCRSVCELDAVNATVLLCPFRELEVCV